jgi:methylmalonyl-CoA epimerase
MKFHHLGIVVKDIDEAAKLYSEMLGLTPNDRGIIENPRDGLRLLLLSTGGDIPIELIQPTSPDNRIARFLRERGEGLFHLCFIIEDFDKKVRALKQKGYTVEEEMAHVAPEHPFKLAWLSPESTRGVWIELADMATHG